MSDMSLLARVPLLLGQVQMPGQGLPGLGGTGEAATTPGLTSGHTPGPSEAPTIIWQALVPLMILSLGAVLLLTISSLVKGRIPSRVYALYTVVVGLATAVAVVPLWARVQGWDRLLWWNLDTSVKGPFSTFGSVCTVSRQAIVEPTCGAVGIDGFSLIITATIGLTVVLGALLASDYLRREGLEGPELYVLLLLSGAGGVVMAVANDLIVLFLGLETLSIAGYVLTALHLRRFQSQEAGIKYFVLGAFASAFFLYGVAMVYGATATTNLVTIRTLLSEKVFAPVPVEGWLSNGAELNAPLLVLGLGLMLVGLGFKVAAVPFHFWSPDVYDGAPTPVVAYMAAGFKAAGFAALVRVFVVGFQAYTNTWRPIVAALAVLSMVVGAALAIVQVNIKRTLAYSSINHAGFILMALAASSAEGNRAVLFYLVTYTFMVAGSFGVATVVARRGDSRVSLDDYRGLSRTSPGLALVFTVFLLAQAGVPFTSGFVAKLYTVVASVNANATWLAIVAMVSSVIAAYLYLRIIVTMYMAPAADEAAKPVRVPAGARLALALCLLVTLVVGVAPGPLTRVAGEGQPVVVNLPEPPAPAADPGEQLGSPAER